ncbi:MAG: 2-C-methyl-D-erythritol 4-phosphate cytidylyltransferase [Oscillospiraceae bacterium]|nr:2-C-methyl-D-erythritol 4-phosphate cytidylyltransferase [Oscillospiraceae bacterium]
MYKRKRVTAVVLAAGSGSRMGVAENKVCLPLDEQWMIAHTLAAFAEHPYVDDLTLVVREEERVQMEALAQTMAKPCRVVLGGATRQASVYNAIADLQSKIVLVHDGARPLIQEACITGCIAALRRYDGVIPALPVEERMCSVEGGGTPRLLTQPLYAAQTPQCFDTKILRRCHERHKDDPMSTDDSRLLEIEGYKVGVAAGGAVNIKVTTPLDLLVAEAYLENL